MTMEEPPIGDVFPEQDEPKRGGLLANWRACLLLAVMVLGLLATPVAILYRWFSAESNRQTTFLSGRAGGGGRIAFITPDGQLATMASDGGDIRQLTDESHRFDFPAWSPDGQQLAVVGGGKVMVINTSEDEEETDRSIEAYENRTEAPFYLYWSPDSRRLTFLASHPEGIALHVIQGQDPEAGSRLLEIGQPFYWDWAPTADQLFVHSGGTEADARLEMIDLRGAVTVDDFGEAGIFQAPGVSYDGRFRAFAALDEEAHSRLVVKDSTGEVRQVEPHFGQLALTWSPVSNLLAYRSPQPDGPFNSGTLRLLDPRTGEDGLLSGQNVLAFFWSPDGQTIAYFTLPRDLGDVRVAAGKTSFRARSQRQPGDLRLEVWAVDIDSGQQRRLAQFTPTGLFLRQFLPYFDQYALSHRIWSPDSDAIIFPIFEEGRSQIALVPTGRGQARLIADGESAFWSHQ